MVRVILYVWELIRNEHSHVLFVVVIVGMVVVMIAVVMVVVVAVVDDV